MLNSVGALSAQVVSRIIQKYKASTVRFAQAVSGIDQPNTSGKMDQEKEQRSKPGDELSGGGYAKRSDEEGYGAVYGGNQSLSKEDEDKIIHGNAPEYDKSERSS